MTDADDGTGDEVDAPKGLLVDYGGVLTPSVAHSFREFERNVGLPKGTVFRAVAEAYAEAGGVGPIARFERGEIEPEEFDRLLSAQLREAGYEVEEEGLARRMFRGIRPEGGMWDVVARAQQAGVRTVLVSNSWGVDDYPKEQLGRVFDEILLSGEVGLRKPDPAFFELACASIGVPPARCAFVDDLERNVEAARELGMFGVVHTDTDETAKTLEGFLDVDLTPGG